MQLFYKFCRKLYITEIFVIFIFVFSINNYFGNAETRINADGIGYYDYLPSIFIHHDFEKKGVNTKETPHFFDRINQLGVYIDYNSTKLNKYSCGTALLQLPFFGYTLLTTKLEVLPQDGYQMPFQRAVFYAALFYLFVTLILLRKLLHLYEVSNFAIIISQLILVFGTSVTHYANVDASYSHVYSLFAITAFVYFLKSYFVRFEISDFLISSLFLGLIFVLRQINILIIFFVPFIAGSYPVLKTGIQLLWKKNFYLILGILITAAVVFIQTYLWYLQIGKFVVYSYKGEGFDFTNPQIINILFSYRKGLFVYTPVLFIALLSTIYLLYKKDYYLFSSWLLFFLFLTYILSSWWAWEYGGSYGMRVYIDYYVIFLIPLALLIGKSKKIIRLIVVALLLLFVPLNFIQAYQHKEFISHWSLMNKEKYWKIFLKTGVNFKGYLWKEKLTDKDFIEVAEFTIPDLIVKENLFKEIFIVSSKEIEDFKNVDFVKIVVDNDFNEYNEAKISFSIDNIDYTENDIWVGKPLMQFADSEFGKWQTGFYYFNINHILNDEFKWIKIKLHTENELVELKNIKIIFLKNK